MPGHPRSPASRSHRSTLPVSLVARLLLLVTAITLTGCPNDKREIEAVRETARIADQARHEQAEQTRTFAELEATLSKERQGIDQERAQAATRHDEAAQSRERAIQAQRQVNEAAARDRFFGQAVLAGAPLLLVGVAIWAALRLAQASYAGSQESDSAVAEALLLGSHLKTYAYDPHLPARMIAHARRGLPHEEPEESEGEPDDSEPEDEGDADTDAKPL